MEATIPPITPLNDQDKHVLEVMNRLGWGLTIPRIAEASQLSEAEVQSSLEWLHLTGRVESRINDKHGCTYWYTKKASRSSMESPVFSICGKVCKNVQGLAIHQARAHGVGHEGLSDSMSMEITDASAVKFVQDLIAKFATIPDARISVTVEFSKGVDA